MEECLAHDEHVKRLLGHSASQHLQQVRDPNPNPNLTLPLTLPSQHLQQALYLPLISPTSPLHL